MKARTCISVASRFGDYRIILGEGIWQSELKRLLSQVELNRLAVVTQQNLLDHYGKELMSCIPLAPERIKLHRVPHKERAKSIEVISALWQKLIEEGFTRDSMILAFGGGVVGDLSGFLASTLLRGIPWVNVSTTLLSQVDASIGGKTGVNLPQGKNLVGTFYPPRQVVMDRSFLETLPHRELKSGLGEVLKYAIGLDPYLWKLLQREELGKIPSLEILEACVRAKVDLVVEDEQGDGARRKLNLGHTIGHAIEGAAPEAMLHGEAVAVGLRFALMMAKEMGEAESSYVERSLEILDEAEMESKAPEGLSFGDLEPFFHVDKKNERGGLQWILPIAPGKCKVSKGLPRERLALLYEKIRAF